MPITKWRSRELVNELMRMQEERMGKAAALVQRAVKSKLNRGAGKSGQSSKPGEPPRKRSGRLYDSIFFQVIRQGDEIIGVIYSDAPHARRMELGFVGVDSLGRTYDQKPRPYLRPAFAETADKVKEILGAK